MFRNLWQLNSFQGGSIDNVTKTFYLACEKKQELCMYTTKILSWREDFCSHPTFPFLSKKREMKTNSIKFTGINTQGLEYSELYKNNKSYVKKKTSFLLIFEIAPEFL